MMVILQTEFPKPIMMNTFDLNIAWLQHSIILKVAKKKSWISSYVVQKKKASIFMQNVHVVAPLGRISSLGVPTLMNTLKQPTKF